MHYIVIEIAIKIQNQNFEFMFSNTKLWKSKIQTGQKENNKNNNQMQQSFDPISLQNSNYKHRRGSMT